MKRRIIKLTLITTATLCVFLAGLLIADRPLRLGLGEGRALHYAGGRFWASWHQPNQLRGPDIVIGYRGKEPYYVNFNEFQRWRAGLPITEWDAYGLSYRERFLVVDRNGAWTARAVVMAGVNAEYPLALVALIGLGALLSHLRHRRRIRRAAAGLCVACGYDLRGSGERCPECGAPREARVAVVA